MTKNAKNFELMVFPKLWKNYIFQGAFLVAENSCISPPAPTKFPAMLWHSVFSPYVSWNSEEPSSKEHSTSFFNELLGSLQ